MSCIFGENRDIFFPKLSESLHLMTFSDIAKKYLDQRGYRPFICKDEDEARGSVAELSEKGQWPCLFSSSDTTGEKDFEEFYTDGELLDMEQFRSLGVIKNKPGVDDELLDFFEQEISEMKLAKYWTKQQLVNLFVKLVPDFAHTEKGRYLDSKM